jgi:predicted RNA binding protein YcfA (HicA-like mRNA interferase family)
VGSARSLTAREIISALIRDGFSLHNQRGSHQRYRHADGRRVTVTYHRPGDTFPMSTFAFHDRDTGAVDPSGPPAPFSHLAELDINPLMVLPRGQGVKAVDALVVLRRT